MHLKWLFLEQRWRFILLGERWTFSLRTDRKRHHKRQFSVTAFWIIYVFKELPFATVLLILYNQIDYIVSIRLGKHCNEVLRLRCRGWAPHSSLLFLRNLAWHTYPLFSDQTGIGKILIFECSPSAESLKFTFLHILKIWFRTNTWGVG